MAILFATLGYTPEKVSHSLPHEQGLTGVVAFFGSRANPSNSRALERVRLACDGIGVRLREHELGDPFDFVGALRAYRRQFAAAREPIVFNASGGTGIMQGAAVLFCLSEGIPLSYYNPEAQHYLRLPALRFETTKSSSGVRDRILEVLMKEKQGLRPGELARRTGLSPSNLDYHLRRLREESLIERGPASEGLRQVIAATYSARIQSALKSG